MGTRFCLVDTPGFDDTYISDKDILDLVMKWLVDTYRKSIMISAILYVHNISQPRMQGSALRTFRIFRNLCGDDFSSKVALLTTFHDLYDQTQPELIASRLDELRHDEFFGSIIARGALMCKAPRTQEGGQSLICDITARLDIPLKVQEEVVDKKVRMEDTLAMKTMFEMELERQRVEYEQKMDEARQEFARQIRDMEEKRTIQLNDLRKELEEKGTTQPKPRRALSEQLDSMSTSKKVDTSPPLPPRRAQTTLDVAFQRSCEERKRRWLQFNKDIQSTLNVLMMGKQNGHIKCSLLLPIKSYYRTVCCHCMRTIGQARSYSQCNYHVKRELFADERCLECVDCADPEIFILCSQCYENDTVFCNNRAHVKAEMIPVNSAEPWTRCPRAGSPPQTRINSCCKCKQNVGICYLRMYGDPIHMEGRLIRRQIVAIAEKLGICVSTVLSKESIVQVTAGVFQEHLMLCRFAFDILARASIGSIC